MMNTDWPEFERKLRQCPQSERYRLQPKLESMITSMKLRGERVPASARKLNTDLREEALEAQFENLPV